jgi:alpha-ketoglutarate-dependent taurine dioxygenase
VSPLDKDAATSGGREKVMASLEVRALDAPFGAEVFGVDPAVLDDETRSVLQGAFDEHGVLVFHDVDFTYATQQRFVEMLVRESLSDDNEELELKPSAYVSNREDGATSASGRILFHTDGMWSTDPFKLVSLYAVSVDEGASPTVFASMTRAWDTLPADLRTRVEGLHVVQSQGTNRGKQTDDKGLTIDPRASGVSRVTPLGLVHPRTGKTVLYVSEQQTREVVELSEDESDELLDALLEHLYSPANVLEYQWRDGDFVAWDNLAVQHARPDVPMDGPARTLRRAVVPPSWLWGEYQQYATSS